MYIINNTPENANKLNAARLTQIKSVGHRCLEVKTI